jgi:hypothetical protein
MTSHRPYSIRIFLPGGDPDGLRTIEKSNWSGCGIVVPRSLFGEARKRKELDRTGVYVLVGPAEESGLPRVYVGEGDPIKQRLEQHASKKDFWITCIAFTSKDENLNKAHVQQLEARLVDLAARAKRCTLDNGNVPQLPSLSEADAADADGFLAEMLLCFPVVGVTVFSPPAAAEPLGRELLVRTKGVEARGFETPGGFLVRAGSGSVAEEVPSIPAFVSEARQGLRANGVLVPAGGHFTFTQDYLFPSPSTAAAVVMGRNANGRIEWRAADGRALKAIQDAEAEA